MYITYILALLRDNINIHLIGAVHLSGDLTIEVKNNKTKRR